MHPTYKLIDKFRDSGYEMKKGGNLYGYDQGKDSGKDGEGENKVEVSDMDLSAQAVFGKDGANETQTLTEMCWGVFGRDLHDGKGPHYERTLFEFCLDCSTDS